MKSVKFTFCVLFAVLLCFAGKTQNSGEVNGYQSSDDAIRMQTGWYDARSIVTAAGHDTIRVDSIADTCYFSRAIQNTTAEDGVIYVLPINSTAYIKVPVGAGEASVLLPEFVRILKASTTIDTFTVFIQKRNKRN
jgi:hypothetical protein